MRFSHEEELPKRFCALSTCFRREAGTAGKDTAGLYRVHQFDKVEQVVVHKADDAEHIALHEEIIANSEGILQALKLPYRVVKNCTGDMGQGKWRMYDIETWMPSRGERNARLRRNHSGKRPPRFPGPASEPPLSPQRFQSKPTSATPSTTPPSPVRGC